MAEKIVLSTATAALIDKTDPQLISPEHNGQRKISWNLLTPPFPGSSSSRPLSASPITDRKITIPTRLDTVHTYQFLGFTEEVASMLLNSHHPSQDPQEVAREWIFTACDGIEDIRDDWDGAMKRAGIKDAIRIPMLKAEHAPILYTQPLKAWLLEIVDTFYDALVNLEANALLNLSQPAAQLRGAHDDEVDYTVPQAPGDHLAVFKSVDGRHTQGCIKEDGTVKLITLESFVNTDFARRGGLYFTHQIWVAKAHSRLINDACSAADRRTVELHVPLSHFDKVRTWELSFGDEWKQMLWYSRRGDYLPKELQKLKSQYGCIQGPIAHSHSDSIVKLQTWKEVSWNHVLTREVEEDGTKRTLMGIQQVWIGESAISELESAVFGKAYVRLPERRLNLVEEPWNDLQHLQ